jgi:preprotein translocase subunit SecG
MEGSRRWIVAIVAAIAIVALILLARGEPGRGELTASSTGIGIVETVAG